MNKAELKKNITKINKLLRSEELVVGIELIKSYNEAELNKAVAKTIITVLKKKFVKAINTSKKSGGRNFNIIDEGIALASELSDILKQKPVLTGLEKDLFDCLLIDTMKNLKYKDALKNNRLDYNIPLDPFINPRNYYPVSTTKQPYYDYIIWNLIGYLTPHIDIKTCKIISYKRYRYNEWYVVEKFPEGICNINSLESLEIVGGRKQLHKAIDYIVHTSLNGGFNIPDTISNLGNLKEFYCNLVATKDNTERYRKQLAQIGFSYDWLYNEKEKERIQELLPGVYIGWKDLCPTIPYQKQCRHCGQMCGEDTSPRTWECPEFLQNLEE
tara:strand:+ start:7615 stop:8598 length:984 start_codon:yes stop_codon:yes gene_type:complete